MTNPAKPNSPPEVVGLIGIGLLGASLAERMLQAGIAVTGFDPSAERREILLNLGGAPLASAEAVAQACRSLVVCLPNSFLVREVIEPLFCLLQRGFLILDATTGDPNHTLAMAERAQQHGGGWIDSAVVGSSEQTRRGEALVLAGGLPTDVAAAQPILHSWSTQVRHVGGCGAGARMKLIVNLVLGLNRAALAEGLALAEASGVDPQAALEVLQAGPAASRIMLAKGPKMLARDYAPQAKLAQHAKDVTLIRELAQNAGTAVPLTEVHEDLLRRAIALGWGDADNSALIEVYRNRAP